MKAWIKSLVVSFFIFLFFWIFSIVESNGLYLFDFIISFVGAFFAFFILWFIFLKSNGVSGKVNKREASKIVKAAGIFGNIIAVYFFVMALGAGFIAFGGLFNKGLEVFTLWFFWVFFILFLFFLFLGVYYLFFGKIIKRRL